MVRMGRMLGFGGAGGNRDGSTRGGGMAIKQEYGKLGGGNDIVKRELGGGNYYKKYEANEI